ncbi:FtsX-like permease family protein [Leifsonia virtsii]|uniref:ABC3 transporter permease C-terminal domain-containing protein n=1 Tax=Leifsonia virtsii TaxID=3035915 RepID=A0ABT8J291_9MICO|nr:FtsX-like permease family protein [Leifsonia virtsii]MDN4599194.1 hypothetical protein [Leifsonia virtsii]
MRAQEGRSGRMRPFWLLRSRAQLGTLISTALVVAVVAFLASVMTGLALRSPDAAVRATLAHEPAAATALALQTSRSTDAAEQDDAVRSVLRSQFRGVPLQTAETAFVPSASVAGGGSASLIVASGDVRDRVRLVSGRWPSTAAEAAVDESFARAHHLAVGGGLTFAGPDRAVPVTVTAVWRPVDPSAPAWLGLRDGADGTDGRVIVSAAVADAASDGTAVQWVVTPDADRVTADHLPRLRAGFEGIRAALSADPTAADSPFSSTGQGLATVVAMQRSVVALQAVIPVPLAVLAVCSVIALALLGRLLADARRPETRLLRSRGVTLPGLAGAAATESAAAAVIAVSLGALGAQAVLLPLTGGPTAGAAGMLDVVLPPLATLAAAVATATLTAVLSARSLTDAPGAVEAGRARSAVSAGLAVLALAAAALTLWRFLVFSSSAGVGGVDPAGVLAPAAVLCAIALLGLSLFGPAAAAVERLAGRGRGVEGVLPARQVGRGIALFSGPVALIVLAVGSFGFAAGYAGTFSGFLHDSGLLTTGAAVRADLGTGGAARSAAALSPASALSHGGTTASPAIVDDGTVGETDVAVVVTDTALLPALVPVGSYLFDAAGVAAALPPRGGIPGADLPAGDRALTLRVAATASSGAVAPSAVTAWLATTQGEAVPVTARPDAGGVVRIPLAAGGPRRLVAVDVTTEPHSEAGATNVEVALSGLPRATAAWSLAPAAFASSSDFVASSAGRAGTATLDRAASARFVPAPASAPLRLVVTQALADDDALQVGQRIDVQGPIGTLTGTVARIVAAVPGTSSERAVLADSSAVTAQLLRTAPAVTRVSSVWATAADADALRSRVAAAVGPDAVVTTADGTFVSRFLSGAVLSTWLGAAGCALLAVAAVAAAISSSLRRRRGEVVVLRAVGLSGGQQAWSRRLEVIGVAVASAVFGLAGGVAVVLLVANTLARLSVVTAPSTLSVQGRVDPVGLAIGLGALAAALALAVWGYGRAVRRQAADTAYREETR